MKEKRIHPHNQCEKMSNKNDFSRYFFLIFLNGLIFVTFFGKKGVKRSQNIPVSCRKYPDVSLLVTKQPPCFSQVSLRISHNIGSGSIGRKSMYILNLERLAAIGNCFEIPNTRVHFCLRMTSKKNDVISK